MNYDYAAQKWLRALECLKEQSIDLIVISGDYSNAGTLSEFERYREQITQSGYTGTIWAAMGNHDSGNRENFLACFSDEGTDGENLYFYRVAENGDVFIFMAQDMLPATGDSSNADCFSDEQMDWLEGLLAQYARTGVNIFLIEHAGFQNWGAGDATPNLYPEPLALREDFLNTLRLKALLEEYKELILCTGHTHVAFSELVNYCDNGGQSARMIHNGSTSQIRTFNANRTKLLYDTNDTDSEGYLVTEYENDIVFRGMDLATHTYLPTACYIMASQSEKHETFAASIDASQSRTEYTEGELPAAGAIVLTVTGEDGSVKTVTEGYTLGLYCGADNALAVDQTKLTGQTDRLLISYGVPSARLAEKGGILCFYSAAEDPFAALAESEKDGLAKISEENSGATLAAERLPKKAGYETALTRWGGASQTPVLVYVLVAAAAVLVIVLIVLLCGMKKRPREK